MRGSETAVTSQDAAFEGFLESLVFQKPDSAAAETESAEAGKIAYIIPDGWTPEEPGPFRVASFSIEREGLPPADVAVTWYPGEAGGLYANVNRWRRQLELPPWTAEKIDAITRTREFNGRVFKIFDLRSENNEQRGSPPERILAAIATDDEGTWFVKLHGDPFVVETQRRRFLGFLSDARFGGAAAP